MGQGAGSRENGDGRQETGELGLGQGALGMELGAWEWGNLDYCLYICKKLKEF
jgi:hypothetical protein